jgi:hypothetical protein
VSSVAVVATAAIPAAIAVVPAYGAARLQGRTQREAMAAELARLRASAEDERLRHRGAVYHDLLKASSGLTESDWSRESRADLERARREGQAAIHAVELFGTQPAREAAVRLQRLHLEMEELGGGRAYDEWRYAVRVAQAAFVEAARLDNVPHR